MKPTPTSNASEMTTVPLLEGLRQRLDWLLTRPQMATGVASLIVVLGLLVVALGLSRWRSDRGELLTQPNDTGVVDETAPGIDPEDDTEVVDETAPGIDSEPDGTINGVATGEAVAAGGETPPADQAPAVGEKAGYELFFPLTASSLLLNPQTAAVASLNGIVEVRTGEDTWTAVTGSATLSAGQRLRTGQLSSATLTFFDGSWAHLGPETEISIDQLNARQPEDGFRTVILTQWLGESEHNVEFRNDEGSRYEVKTPGGNGLARGTRFRVAVTPNLLARFIVTEGRVDVSNLNATVAVVAGQLTTTMAGRAPAEPAFNITGEGIVSQTGAAWIVAGQTFQTNETTFIVGNPQVGDLVRVEGRLLSDGARLADLIVLRQRAAHNRFQLTGEVEAIDAAAWTIAGQTILVDDSTRMDGRAAVGDTVRVEGVIRPGGALFAERIARVQVAPGLPFSFTGVVQRIDANTWRISGQAIQITDNTAIADGLAVGDVVAVHGLILDNGRWRAQQIERVTGPERSFEIAGLLQSKEPWSVADILFGVRDWTVVEPGLSVGDRVRVRGVILADGTWVASHIASLDDDGAQIFAFVGIVNSINPWIINGIRLDFPGNGNDNSSTVGNIQINTLVQVKIRILDNGRWVISHIRAIHSGFGLGCLTVSSVVVSVGPDQLVVRHWPAIALGGAVNAVGNVRVDNVVTFPFCTHFDGTITVINIVVIYNAVIIIAPPPAPSGPPSPPRGNRNGDSNGNHNG